jgi:hypothetical protein
MTSALLISVEGTGCDVPYLLQYKMTMPYNLQCPGNIPVKNIFKACAQ